MDLEAADKYGKMALHLAAEQGNETAVQLLVDRGASTEARDNNGWTPLAWRFGNGTRHRCDYWWTAEQTLRLRATMGGQCCTQQLEEERGSVKAA